MSVTKFENTEKELVFQEGINSEKVSTQSSRCSCLNCDSKDCFEKRNKAIKDCCQCSICKELRKKQSLICNEKSYNKKDLEIATKKIIKEVVTRETIESLKRVTETMYEFAAKENFGMIPQRQATLSDTKISSPVKSPISIKIESSKKISIGDININSKIGGCKQNPIVKALSTDIPEPQKDNSDINNTATKLSAQVMNVPYEDIHETVPSSQDITEGNPLTKFNIFKRIKEIYEACSCKVCKCITSKPREIRDDFCDCQPCQCHDCVKLRIEIEEKINHKPYLRCPHSGCPCIRCDRKDCRGIVKNISETQPCECSPTDTIPYSQILTKQCKCEPCQCLSCRLLGSRTQKTVKLGEVDAYIERETCQCSPCECIECKQMYSRTDPTIMCTHSAYANRYNNICHCDYCTESCQFGMPDICTCDSHDKPLRKSINKNCRDYDIHTVIVDNNGPFIQHKASDSQKYSTVALASLKNNYPSHSYSRNTCKCTDCECLVCTAKDDSLKNYRDKFKHNMAPHNDMKLTTPRANACKCTPCECEICSKKGEIENSINFERKCRCNICDCLNCDNTSLATSSFPNSSIPRQSNSIHRKQSAKPIRCIGVNKNCNCNLCECSNCTKLFSCSSSVKFYSGEKKGEKKTRRSRKVMLVTPCTSESHLKSRNTYVQSVSSTSLSPKESIEKMITQDLITCHAVSHNYAPLGNYSHSNKKVYCQLYEDNVISDDDVDGDLFYKLNNPVLDAASAKSIENTPILNYSCNLTQSLFKTYEVIDQAQKEPREPSKHFLNIIHEQQNKITCNDSDESSPVYSTCYEDMLYPRSSSRNIKITCKKSKTNLKDVSSYCLNKKQYLKNKTRDQVWEDIDNVDLPQELQKCTDFFSLPFNKEYRKTSVNHSDISIDYERAARVLYEAKAFSTKLIKMLDSFETANSQFKSASQKLQVVHDSLLKMNECEPNKTYNINFARTSKSLFENSSGIISDVNYERKQSTGESAKDENEAEREYEQFPNRPKDVRDKFHYPEQSYKNDILVSKHLIQTIVNADDIYGNGNSEINREINDSTDLDLSQTDLNNKNKNNKFENITQKPINKRKLDSALSKITTTDKSVATKDVQESLIGLLKPQEKQSWQILKKNLYFNSCPDNKKTVLQSQALELDIKEAIQAISSQATNGNYAKVVPRPNEALVNLQSAVKDLFNMPLLQNNSTFNCKGERDGRFFPRNKLDLEVKSLLRTASSQTYDQIIEKADKEVYFNTNSENCKVSCDQLKATFTGLRRVSDHTVLVKWKVPERIDDVQGYELLVDGRAVQKIFSPTRSMAVVTCLPPSARVLLTVRTIVASDCGHTPASTIVYRPRIR